MSIHGLGQFQGPLKAFADGVVGGPPGSAAEGELAAFKDGSLGALGQQYFPGPDGPAAYIAHAGVGTVERSQCVHKVFANCFYHTFGYGPRPGEWACMNGRGPCDPAWSTFSSDILVGISAVRDCVKSGVAASCSQYALGEYFRPQAGVGEYFRPAQGIGEYFAAQGLGLFGRSARGPEGALDLASGATVKEVKGAMALLVPQVIAGASSTYSPAWFSNGIWDAAADALWANTAQMLAAAGHIDPMTLTASGPRADGSTAMWPNASGVRALLLVYTASAQYGPSYVVQNFPTLSKWASSSSMDVMPPQTSGIAQAKMAKMALWGAAGVAVIGVAVAMSKKKRR